MGEGGKESNTRQKTLPSTSRTPQTFLRRHPSLPDTPSKEPHRQRLTDKHLDDLFPRGKPIDEDV
jgi:hypothetical protein